MSINFLSFLSDSLLPVLVAVSVTFHLLYVQLYVQIIFSSVKVAE